MDVYRTLATILVTNPSSSSSPIFLITSQLSSPCTSSEQKAGLSRILAELLRSTPDAAAQQVLRDYVLSLVLSADLSDACKDFQLAVELADDNLLAELLAETMTRMGKLLKMQSSANVSSDEGFAVDFSGFFDIHFPRFRDDFMVALEEVQDLTDSATRLLRFWHFAFLAKDRFRSTCLTRSPGFAGLMLPVHLLGLMALRDPGIAKAASDALYQLLNDFRPPAQSSQVVIALCHNRQAFPLGKNGG